MSNLYELIKTKSKNEDSAITERLELLFDLKGNSYSIFNTHQSKNIMCISGACVLNLNNGNTNETVLLNNPKYFAKIDKNVSINIGNYSDKTKVVVEYIKNDEMCEN